MANHEAAVFMLRRPIALPLPLAQDVIAGRSDILRDGQYILPGDEAWNLVAERLDVLCKAIP